MPLKSRATTARVERAENPVVNDEVQPRGGNVTAIKKETTEPDAGALSKEDANMARTDIAQPVKAPRKARTPKAPAATLAASQGEPLDKKAVRARLSAIEKEVKASFTAERVAARALAGDFAAKRSGLKNEHGKLSAQLSAAAFGG